MTMIMQYIKLYVEKMSTNLCWKIIFLILLKKH